MTTQTEIGTLAVKVGEISGQLRELIHQQNNMAMKLDGLTERMLTSPTQADYEKLNARLDTLSARVDALESVNDRNDGAKGLLATLLGSKAFGVLVSVTLIAYASIKEGLFK